MNIVKLSLFLPLFTCICIHYLQTIHLIAVPTNEANAVAFDKEIEPVEPTANYNDYSNNKSGKYPNYFLYSLANYLYFFRILIKF